MPIVITGTNGVIYHGFLRRRYGPWFQILKGPYPHHITLGGIPYYLAPPPYVTKYSSSSSDNGFSELNWYGPFQ
jgi:hypothetical protein